MPETKDYLRRWSETVKSWKTFDDNQGTTQLPKNDPNEVPPWLQQLRDKAATTQFHAPKKQEPEIPYVKVFSIDTPTVMLYRACITCVSTHKRVPHTLYIHNSLESELIKELEENLHYRYDGHYYFFSGQCLEKIYVQPDIFIPTSVGNAIGWTFPRDMVIAILSK